MIHPAMKALWVFVLISTTVFGQAPAYRKAPPTVSDLGFAYQLSHDWILATTMMRKQAAAQDLPADTIVLAAVYVPKKTTLSRSSPFFSLLAFPHVHADCAQFLDTMTLQLEKQGNTRIKSKKRQFSVAERNFLRTDFEQKAVLRHRAFVCTETKDYVVVWNAGAGDEQGVETVVSTLESIAPGSREESSNSTEVDGAQPLSPRQPETDTVETLEVKSGITSGLLLKKVAPVYTDVARAAGIQGTVVLSADISREGDIVNLEVLDGPIELVGSAVDAVRRWKYRPYLLNGKPVEIRTQIQVNYVLGMR